MTMRFYPGDVVLHRPSGQKWLVAAHDPETGDLMWCGWPEGYAHAKDCDLVKAATPEKRAEIHAMLSGARRVMADRVYGPIDRSAT